ncbi:MAG: substrate-binding domain-containing protein [Oscillospiraceae bacterium]|jgi:phosphate transport system substrate-binding protein|nr:substrate-binding domain-containing protein [Oscillospiraceae bacterium]
MKKTASLIFPLIALLIISGCGVAAGTGEIPGAETGDIEGNSAVELERMPDPVYVNLDFDMLGDIGALPYMLALTESYTAEYEGAKMDFAVVGRDEALEMVQSGGAQIAVLTGEVPGGRPVAHQCLGIAAHPGNAAEDLTCAQLFDIFSGAVADWGELGFDDAPIRLYLTENASASRQTFEEILSLRSTSGIARSLISPSAVILSDEDEVAGAVVSDRFALGIVWAGSAPNSVKLLSVDSVAPSKDTVSSYPFARPIMVVGDGEDVETILEYIKSPSMASVARSLGLWPIS